MRIHLIALPFFLSCLFPISNLSAADAVQAKEQTVFIVVRHGESDHNVRNLFNSRPGHSNYFESHLTEHGKEQVAATGMQLEKNKYTIANVYHGPLPRTIETAQILNGYLKGKSVHNEPRLIEAGAGDLEGKSNSTVQDNWGIEDIAKHYHGESREEMRTRLCSFMNDMVQNHRNEVILVVTHGSPSDMILKMLNVKKSRLDTAGSAVVPYPGALVGCEGTH